jgi:hypothetical protein
VLELIIAYRDLPGEVTLDDRVGEAIVDALMRQTRPSIQKTSKPRREPQRGHPAQRAPAADSANAIE